MEEIEFAMKVVKGKTLEVRDILPGDYRIDKSYSYKILDTESYERCMVGLNKHLSDEAEQLAACGSMYDTAYANSIRGRINRLAAAVEYIDKWYVENLQE